ncbi:Universal stress protein A-like protein [Linum grandiflorum]
MEAREGKKVMTMMMKNKSSGGGGGEERVVVVAVDESEESMNALSWCLNNLVSNPNSHHSSSDDHIILPTVVLLYVKPPPPVYPSFTAAAYMFNNDVIATMERHSAEMVSGVMRRAEAVYSNFLNHVRLERAVGSGEPKEVICHTVNQLGADTLVMGCHGYGFIKRALLGSVSDYCAKHVKCPVVIVKRQQQH